jgi:hypothetical protein
MKPTADQLSGVKLPPHQVRALSQEELDRLSQNPRNRIYQYKYGNTIEEMPAARVRHIVLTLLSFSHQYANKPQNLNCTEQDIQKAARQSNEMFAKFEQTHPMMFKECTKKKSPSPQELEIILTLIKLKENEQKKQITTEDACKEFVDLMKNK